MHRGYVKLWRKILDTGILKEPELLAFWVWCTLKACHKPQTMWFNGIQVHLNAGEFVTSRSEMRENLHQTDNQIRSHIKRLIFTNQITNRTTKRYTIISIVNWDIYQFQDFIINQQNNQQNNQQTTNRPPTDHQPLYIEECKNVRMKEYNIPDLQSDNGNDFFTKEELEEKPKPKKEPRKKFGEYKHVLLTKTDYERLSKKLGSELLLEAIRILDEGIEVKGYKYKNFSLVLQKWPLERARESLGQTNKSWTTWGDEDE